MEPAHRLAATHKGFTLVEMLVVLSIIAIITTIALFGQAGFNRSVLLTDTAYTVALSLRQAQSLGLSSRAFGGIQNPGYGGYFAPASSGSYTLFADTGGTGALSNCPTGTAGQPDQKPGNCRYDAGTDGILQTYTFSNRVLLSHVCGTDMGTQTRYCSDTHPLLTAVHVAYIRSNTTDTVMTGLYNGGTIRLSKVEIYVASSDRAATRGVCVSQVGQVSIVTGTCP